MTFFFSEAPNSYKFQKILCNFLQKKKNWIKIPYKKNTIVHWCYNSSNSIIKSYPYYTIFTRKDLFFLNLRNTNINLPYTYLLTNGSWYPHRPIKKKTIWFFKHPYLDGSRGIMISKNVDKFISHSCKKPQHSFIIQENIPRIWLFNGRKCDIRLWGIIIGDKNRLNLCIFKKGTLRVNPNHYCELSDDLNFQLTNSSFFKKKISLNNLIYPFTDNIELYNLSFNKIIQQLTLFWKKIYPILQKKTYQGPYLELFGFDFICNKDGIPFFIECNRKPNYHNIDRYQECVETLIPNFLEPLLQKKKFISHPLWINLS